MDSASIAATEGPALLGYLTLGLALGLMALGTYLASSEARARRARNRTVRHARAGCVPCRRLLDLDAQRTGTAIADVDAWLDYPTAGGTR